MTKKKAADKRVDVFTLRMSRRERASLEAVAKHLDVNASDVIRDAVNVACTEAGCELVFRAKGEE